MHIFKKTPSMEEQAGSTKKTPGHTSNTSNRSVSLSDTDSQFDSFHSPLRSESQLHSDTDFTQQQPHSTALVKYVKTPTPPKHQHPSPLVIFNSNRNVKHDGGPGANNRSVKFDDGHGGLEEGDREVVRQSSDRTVLVKRAEMGFRVCEAVLCLIAFSVMAANKTQGWSGDSFDRYKEYRYCVAVTVIGFTYSVFQAWDLAYNLVTGKHMFSYHLRYHFVFAMDQILAYLLISASSSAATRVDNWVSNWGKDDFTEMATASISMSFLAFAAFAISSLISGYNLCNRSTS